jgi:HPt (histidine-containing phosphotransfer) domain-containing protein
MDPELFQGLDALRKEYLDNIYQEMQEIAQRLEEQKQCDEQDIRKYAHKIFGSGTSYGFDYISETGHELSRLAKENADVSAVLELFRQCMTRIEKSKKNLKP